MLFKKTWFYIGNDQSIKNKHEELERIHLSPQKIREKFVEKARSDVDKMLASLLVLSSKWKMKLLIPLLTVINTGQNSALSLTKIQLMR